MGVVGVSLFSMVAAFGTVNDAPLADIPRQQVVEQLALPPLTASADNGQSFLREER
jgi:hypothetical protein